MLQYMDAPVRHRDAPVRTYMVIWPYSQRLAGATATAITCLPCMCSTVSRNLVSCSVLSTKAKVEKWGVGSALLGVLGRHRACVWWLALRRARYFLADNTMEVPGGAPAWRDGRDPFHTEHRMKILKGCAASILS
jgi:hypothetical protein